MATKRKPIVKLSRRLGVALGGEKWVNRRPYAPGVHGPTQARRKPRLSDYGRQLMEKQKAKALYGILEKQFSNYVEEAASQKGNTAVRLVQLLELRLDNVIYRLGIAKTRRQARQMVSHGFVTVNEKPVNIPSFRVAVGQQIGIKENKRKSALVSDMPERLAKHETPKWLSMDAGKGIGKVTALPEGEDLRQVFEPASIVEFYSR
jgi:small subunit ribosomal protein S4